ncbi:hypothetical protein CANCADRAFT_56288 [Tortispora caseinolytica NRRL Y-17796]|uniref:Uncharacterized protein n=1 Tax=Tortispora caseinolytica NRRL Y-17796 TaxID=767744 RepID=A0A1E4TLK1_9ASCO|nr:hypothetical protein CANCADRAFT_56288 [Tortispora caseinolytica NRRL Y-17796]
MANIHVIADDIQKPLLDDRQYRVVQLPNQLEATLIHDPETDKASAALDVNVGSFADYNYLPGLAHFCEHLLFMGTKKYPKENEYSQYLSQHSGHSNAYTSTDSTNYYFEVGHEFLKGAMDRFSQFFIEPLFNPECKDREIRAVDSENKKNLQSDMWRLHQLDCSLSNPEHPHSGFSTGNLQTLSFEPGSKGIDVREELLKYYHSHYSANIMKLVVVGREDLDTLQNWITEMFSPIKNLNIPAPPTYDAPPYRPEDLGFVVYAKPVMDSHTLSLMFPFPDQDPYFETLPAHYFSHLIGHEGPGSILAYLKSKGLATGLSAGCSHVSTGYDSFSIDVELSKHAVDQWRTVLDIVFQYLTVLKNAGPQDWIFDELREMSVIEFKYRHKIGAANTASRLAAAMQKIHIPRDRLLSASSVFVTYKPEVISQFGEYFSPNNFRCMLVSQDYPGDWDQTEKWYGTQYRIEQFSKDFLSSLGSSGSLPELHLPAPNEFIPRNLATEKTEITEKAQAPTLLRDESYIRLWHKKDDTFWMPKGSISIEFFNNIASESAKNSAMASFVSDMLTYYLNEYSYAADMAGLKYKLSSSDSGMVLSISGYNDKLHVLLEKILQEIVAFTVKPDIFKVVKQKLTQKFANFGYNAPYTQIGIYGSYVLNERSWSVEEKLEALATVTEDDVNNFSKKLFSNLFFEMLVHGNITKDQAFELAKLTTNTFGPESFISADRQLLSAYILPEGKSFRYDVPLTDRENVNSCIDVFFQVGELTDRVMKAKLDLLSQIAVEPAFDRLRTEEQLGYVVFSGTRTSRTTAGFRVLIQSERDCRFLDNRIEAFLVYLEEILTSMNDEDFAKHVHSLTVKKLEKIKSLQEEGSRFWGYISSRYYNFTQRQEDVQILAKLTKSEIIEFFNEYISAKSPKRTKLIVSLVSHKTPNDYIAIEDVQEFKSSLKLAARPVPMKDLSIYKDSSSAKL